MKESNKESKEEIQKEGRIDSAFSREDLKIDFDAFLRFFNQTLRDAGSNIAMQAYISKGYRHRLQHIANEYNSKAPLITAVRKMAASNFLNGRNKKYRFKASFVWLFEKDEHFERVLSGYYDNPPDADKTPAEEREEELEKRRQEYMERRAEAERILEEQRQRENEEREKARRNAVTPEEAERQGFHLQFISKIMAEEG